MGSLGQALNIILRTSLHCFPLRAIEKIKKFMVLKKTDNTG
jgi:hypothetical protein